MKLTDKQKAACTTTWGSSVTNALEAMSADPTKEEILDVLLHQPCTAYVEAEHKERERRDKGWKLFEQCMRDKLYMYKFDEDRWESGAGTLILGGQIRHINPDNLYDIRGAYATVKRAWSCQDSLTEKLAPWFVKQQEYLVNRCTVQFQQDNATYEYDEDSDKLVERSSYKRSSNDMLEKYEECSDPGAEVERVRARVEMCIQKTFGDLDDDTPAKIHDEKMMFKAGDTVGIFNLEPSKNYFPQRLSFEWQWINACPKKFKFYRQQETFPVRKTRDCTVKDVKDMLREHISLVLLPIDLVIPSGVSSKELDKFWNRYKRLHKIKNQSVGE